jgi:hypothetical protein
MSYIVGQLENFTETTAYPYSVAGEYAQESAILSVGLGIADYIGDYESTIESYIVAATAFKICLALYFAVNAYDELEWGLGDSSPLPEDQIAAYFAAPGHPPACHKS